MIDLKTQHEINALEREVERLSALAKGLQRENRKYKKLLSAHARESELQTVRDMIDDGASDKCIVSFTGLALESIKEIRRQKKP